MYIIYRVFAAMTRYMNFTLTLFLNFLNWITKERAQIDRWMKDVAPTTALRKQFHQNPQNWPGFEHDYIAELQQQENVKELAELIQKHETVTLLYAANNEQQNHALILQQFLQATLKDNNAI